jgi:hypothetical protein
LEEGVFTDQVNIASGENSRIADQVAAAGLDPSSLVWGSEWGLALADQGAAALVSDEVRSAGLLHLWSAAMQGYLLQALPR